MSSHQSETVTSAEHALVTLPDAAQAYRGVTVRALRAWIHRGLLPASKVGKVYLVAPADVAKLLEPKVRPAPAPRSRESERARIERQLRDAGVST